MKAPVKTYGLRKCTTCQNALKYLAERKVKTAFTDYRESPPTREQVARWSKAVGGWEKLMNRAGYTWRGLAAAETRELTEARAIALAVRYPSLIRRPLIEHEDGTVTVGFSARVRTLF
jgi:Spx/MgsR family transcriptional regulator